MFLNFDHIWIWWQDAIRNTVPLIFSIIEQKGTCVDFHSVAIYIIYCYILDRKCIFIHHTNVSDANNNVFQMHFPKTNFTQSMHLKIFHPFKWELKILNISKAQSLSWYILQEIYASVLEFWFIKVLKLTIKFINQWIFNEISVLGQYLNFLNNCQPI